jgi:hypothetical protein
VVENRQKKLVQLLTKAWNLDKRTTRSTVDKLFYAETLKGVYASGHPADHGFLVMKGAKFSPVTSSSYSLGYIELRNKLIEQKIIEEQGDYLVLNHDYLFTSPSTASSLVLGRNSNGLTDWKLSNGMTLKKRVRGVAVPI